MRDWSVKRTFLKQQSRLIRIFFIFQDMNFVWLIDSFDHNESFDTFLAEIIRSFTPQSTLKVPQKK